MRWWLLWTVSTQPQAAEVITVITVIIVALCGGICQADELELGTRQGECLHTERGVRELYLESCRGERNSERRAVKEALEFLTCHAHYRCTVQASSCKHWSNLATCNVTFVDLRVRNTELLSTHQVL